MIKKYSILVLFALVAAASLSTATPSNASDIENGTAGDPITAIGTPAFNFQPSPQVLMNGVTSAEAFFVQAAHNGSFNKPNGEEYAMSSDSSGLYFKTLDGVATTDGLGDPLALPADDTEMTGGGYKLQKTTTTPAPAPAG